MALQEGQTSCDTTAIANVFERGRSGEAQSNLWIVSAAGDRYRHGKLIEWLVGDQRWALTGSPNLSAAAMLPGAVGQERNYELALVGPLGSSLFPEGEVVQLDEVEVAVLGDRLEGASVVDAPKIIGAVNGPEDTTVYMAQVASGVRLESSALQGAPEEWETVCTVEEWAASVTVAPAMTGGSRLRLVWSDGCRESASPPFFLTEPSQAFVRPGGGEGRSRSWSTSPEDLLGEDLAALGWVIEELTALAHGFSTQAQAQALAAPTKADGHDGRGGYLDSDVEPWLWSAPVVDRLGPRLAAYALALPGASAANVDEADAPTWSDTALEEEVGGLLEETAESVVETGLEVSLAEERFVDHRYDAAERRAARRSLCAKLVDQGSSLPVPYLLFGLRLQLTFWCGDNWDDGDSAPVRHIKVWLDRLAAKEPGVDEAVRVGSLAAIALSMLRSLVRPDAADERTMLIQRVLLDHGDLVTEADHEIVALYLDGMVPSWDAEYWSARTFELVEDHAAQDPLAMVEDHLLGLGAEVSRPSLNSLHARRDVKNVALAALETLRSVDESTQVAVWTSNFHGSWALAVWSQREVLLVSQPESKRVRWRHFVLSSQVGVGALHAQLRAGSVNPALERRTRPPFQATDAARGLLATLGICKVQPPLDDE